MANTKIIKNKIKAITSIKKITKTMEMVAVSKMKKSVTGVTDIREYIEEIKFVINKIKSESEVDHVLFNNSKIKTVDELVIIFASNKGLCGSYNTNVYKKTKKLKDENPNLKYAICFGKFAEKTARKLGLEIKLSYLDIEKLLHPTQISKVENFARKMYLNTEVSKVHAVYTNFIKMGVFEPRAVTLYPVNKNLNTYTDDLNVTSNVIVGDKKEGSEFSTQNSSGPKQIYIFEPYIETLIAKSVPNIIKIILYSFILESRASENASRSFAMKRANESAGEMLHGLKIKYNKVRQDGITQEIAEISAGANAG
jgi:F-type H+-transporting ATPase subunit gamma